MHIHFIHYIKMKIFNVDFPKNNDSVAECSICLERIKPFVQCKQKLRTQCKHFFHRDCYIQAILSNPTCPNCRDPTPPDWFRRHNVLPIKDIHRYTAKITDRLQYWEDVEDRLEEPPPIGPMLPSHQRWYNMDIIEETDSRPAMWTRMWISDRLCEMRIRFNIPAEIRLTEKDILICENNGIRGIYPEWSPEIGQVSRVGHP